MDKDANPKTSIATERANNAPAKAGGYNAVVADRQEPRHAKGAKTGMEKGGKY